MLTLSDVVTYSTGEETRQLGVTFHPQVDANQVLLSLTHKVTCGRYFGAAQSEG